MGCLLDKDAAGQPRAHQPSVYTGQPVYAQSPHAYGQQSPYGQQPPHGQQPAYGQVPVYGQPPPAYAPGPQWQAVPQQEPPFMRMASPNGASWAEYVKTGGRSYVDPGTGFLAGPWAECISWGVRFEHASDWRSMPEYVDQDGPVGGVLSAFEASTKSRLDGHELLAAASRLEEASHAAEEEGRPLPGLQQGALAGRPAPSAQSYQQQPPAYGQRPLYSPQPPFGQSGPCGQPGPFGQPAAYREQPMYGQAPASWEPAGWGAQQPYQQQQQPGMGGPTLLQQQAQSQGGGMGTGAKVAMAAVGGICAGAGALYVADHMDEVGQALDGAGEWVAGAAEDVGGFVGDVADDFF